MQRETRREDQASYVPLSLDALLPTSRSESLNETGSYSLEDGSVLESLPIPKMFGRYAVSSLLGEGGYGRVFKAFDGQLQRHVAVKVPHRYLSSAVALEKYLEEARTLAKMQHPGIVGVHDVGVTDDGQPYIVSEFVDGCSLASRMQSQPLSLKQAIKVLIDVGTALGYVHAQGIVHRDLKPGNILLDKAEKPFLADFGLALRDEIGDPSRSRVGTPAYMSPEQARGESHLVDGRSDIFSLGVVLYEMVTGVRPFRGHDRKSVVYKLLNKDPSPPRQHNASLPRDLERVCLKALAKPASQRYSTASDLVDDLAYFLATHDDASISQSMRTAPDSTQASERLSGVVPRGLRSYDRHDSAFFHRLLPGPRDRDWVPESIRFWQRQIEGSEVDEPPRVGVLYGPSGCGKSSFVKAGLLPLLGSKVTTVFVEATRGDTESRLLRGVRRAYPNADADVSLVDTMATLRKNFEATNDTDKRRRLLIVIDQFEQWLHGRSDEDAPELATALRQCDGHHVQCLLLIRDDFWLALSRFMALLEVPLKQNYNAALVDLFSTRHARHVLAELGVAYDRLPANAKDFSNEQERFLDNAATELSEAGKVFPVRLALFVEMVKSRPWDVTTLTQVGGVKGLGVQFLEESFSSDLAPAAQRTHEPAVRQVLRALLPEHGVGIKGNMESEEALLNVSGYQERPDQFDEMMRILDSELRLVTPTDPSGTTTSEDSISQSGDGVCYYQLTHDFLVPAVEQWLTQRQRETRKGLAELRLAEYANLWSAKPIPKFAPSWFDWLSISFWTSSESWKPVEREMMSVAARRHVLRTMAVVTALLLAFTLAWMYRSHFSAIALAQQLRTARTSDIPSILEEIRESGSNAKRELITHLNNTEPGGRDEVVCRLGLLSSDSSQADILNRLSIDLELALLLVVRDELHPLTESQRDFLNSILLGDKQPSSRRLRAAMMLGEHAAVQNQDEPAVLPREAIIEEALRHSRIAPQDHSSLVSGLLPLADNLIETLRKVALQPKESQARSIATSFLTQFLKDRPDDLLDFFLDSDAAQHEAILPLLDVKLSGLSNQLHHFGLTDVDSDLAEAEYDALARRQGTAAALLHRLGSGESTWRILKHSPWPHSRGYMMDRVPSLGGDFEETLARFSREPEVSIRRALLLMLGRFRWNELPETLQLQAVSQAKDAFEHDPDIGVHSAAQWALTKWGQRSWIMEATKTLSKSKPDPRKNWYVNGEGQTMAVFDARKVDGIGRIFELATMEVTVDQFKNYDPAHTYYEYRSPTGDCPVGLTDWYDAIGYCRWLSEELDSDPRKSYPSELQRGSPDVSYDDVMNSGSYRLPTSAEWVYACAASTTSRRFYGYSDSLADQYLFHFDTSQNPDGEVRYFPAASKMPNDFGMYAMYDGIREWGHESAGARRKVMGFSSGSELRDPVTFRDSDSADFPRSRNGFYGLRVARTVLVD